MIHLHTAQKDWNKINTKMILHLQPECYAAIRADEKEEKEKGKRSWERDPCFALWQCPADKEETKCLKQGLGAAAAGVFGFSVHQKEICGPLFCRPWGMKGEKWWSSSFPEVFRRRVPQQWNLPDIFQVLPHLQDDLAQNIHFCCFLNHWWSETGMIDPIYQIALEAALTGGTNICLNRQELLSEF